MTADKPNSKIHKKTMDNKLHYVPNLDDLNLKEFIYAATPTPKPKHVKRTKSVPLVNKVVVTTQKPVIKYAVECDAVRIYTTGNGSNHGTINIRDTVYNGIPAILALNIVCWILMVMLFAVLRKYAFKDEDKPVSVTRSGTHNGGVDSSTLQISQDMAYSRSQSTHATTPEKDTNMFSFITRTIHLNDIQFSQKCGSSAVQYLRFQRFVWYLLFLVTLASCIVILPANTFGTLTSSKTSFKRTTIANLSPNSDLIWIHTMTCVVFVFLGVKLMTTFRKSTLDAVSTSARHNTPDVLLFSDLPLNEEKKAQSVYKREDEMRRHLEIAYHGCDVKDIQFAFDYEEATETFNKFAELEFALELATDEEREVFNHEMASARTKLLQDLYGCKRLPVAFVKLSQAARVYRDFNHGLGTPAKSPYYLRLKVESWTVERCPTAEDIFWSGLAKRCGSYAWVRTIAINCALFIILLFFTTPAILVNSIERLRWITKLNDLVVPVFPQFSLFTNFLPTLFMWTFAALLPYAVASLSQVEGHWTVSGCNLITMRRCFFFLISMVLILPSIGLASFDIVLEHLFRNATAASVVEETRNRFRCIFLPDNGAFFINYVTTSAFIGTGLELLRTPELLLYLIKRCFVKGPTRKLMLQKERQFEFQYGLQYAWMLTIITTTISYSIVCPLITPIGLAYLTLKHHVDKYNLYYAYKPSRLDRKCHQSAIRYVLLSLFLLVLNVLFFTLIRTDTSQGFLGGLANSPQAIFLIAVMIGYGGIRCWGKLDAMDNDEYEDDTTKSYGSRNTTPSRVMADNVYLPEFLFDLLFPTLPEPDTTHLEPNINHSVLSPKPPPATIDHNDRMRIQHKLGLLEPSAGGLGHEGELHPILEWQRSRSESETPHPPLVGQQRASTWQRIDDRAGYGQPGLRPAASQPAASTSRARTPRPRKQSVPSIATPPPTASAAMASPASSVRSGAGGEPRHHASAELLQPDPNQSRSHQRTNSNSGAAPPAQ